MAGKSATPEIIIEYEKLKNKEGIEGLNTNKLEVSIFSLSLSLLPSFPLFFYSSLLSSLSLSFLPILFPSSSLFSSLSYLFSSFSLLLSFFFFLSHSLQMYLSASEFTQVFDMNREDFQRLAEWQQVRLRKAKGLF